MRKGEYFTIRYDKGKDEFQIWLCNGDPEKDMGFCLGCKCIADTEHHTEAEYIHYSILTKVRDLLAQGWKYYN